MNARRLERIANREIIYIFSEIKYILLVAFLIILFYNFV